MSCFWCVCSVCGEFLMVLHAWTLNPASPAMWIAGPMTALCPLSMISQNMKKPCKNSLQLFIHYIPTVSLVYYIKSNYIILCYIMFYDVKLCFMLSYCITWYHIVSYYLILSHHIISYYIILHHDIWIYMYTLFFIWLYILSYRVFW